MTTNPMTTPLTPEDRLEALAQMRTAGWSVAVHNDYRLYGVSYTFWLFTHPDGRWVKGEGTTDEAAIEEAHRQAAAILRAPKVEGASELNDGWLPIVICPTDEVLRLLKLPDGGEVVGAFMHKPGRWRYLAAVIENPAHPLPPIGGVERTSTPYPTRVFKSLPDNVYPTHFRPNDTVHGAPQSPAKAAPFPSPAPDPGDGDRGDTSSLAPRSK